MEGGGWVRGVMVVGGAYMSDLRGRGTESVPPFSCELGWASGSLREVRDQDKVTDVSWGFRP